MKIAIFVEGFTELNFVRELILRNFDYSDIQVKCSLLNSGQFQKINYDFPAGCDLSGNINYHIICCQGDALISKIRRRKKYLIQNGYTKIVGLRDVYSQEYSEYSNEVIDLKLIEEMAKKHDKALLQILGDEIAGSISFAQMETECWYLSIPGFFEAKNEYLTIDIVRKIISSYGNPEDVESTVYQPAKCLEKIYEEVGDIYSKKQHQAEALANYVTLDQVAALYKAKHTIWFNKLCDLLNLSQIISE